MQSSSYAKQDRLLTRLERDLPNVIETADAAMRALNRRRETSKFAVAEFRKAMTTKVRARKILRSVETLRKQGGIALGPKGFRVS
jgi:hypothetical protein